MHQKALVRGQGLGVPLTLSQLDRELVFSSSPTRIDEDSSVNNNELFCSKLAWRTYNEDRVLAKQKLLLTLF